MSRPSLSIEIICIHPDAVCANNEVRGHHSPVFESDCASLGTDALAADRDVSPLARYDG